MTGIVRPERDSDISAIREVHQAAFGRAAEAWLVDALRANGKLLISLVMDCEGMLVGHIAFSPVKVEEQILGVGLAPLGVLPSHQRTGIGTQLVREGLDACRRASCGFVVVLGEPSYYGRFGFIPASSLNLENEYDAREEFMVIELQAGALPAGGGLVRYSAEFETVTEWSARGCL